MGQGRPTNSDKRDLSLKAARALANRWTSEKEDFEREGAIQARFAGFSAHQLLDMWESCKNEHGRRLTKFEGEALACALHAAFDFVPGSRTGQKQEAEQLPSDDTMLDMSEVVRVTGISRSSIKRYVATGVFPQPVPLTPGGRRIGWPARKIHAYLEQMAELRRTTRRY